jgi:hypothetical protein
MEIVSLSGLPAGSLLWQKRPGVWALTVVCKATFSLCPGDLPLAPEQEPLNESDRPWSDELRSLYASADLVPMKPRADVVLVGQAYAPNGMPVPSLIARLTVSDVDKAVEIFGDRTLRPDGTIQEGPPFARMPLLYERAAGGVATSNPAGMSLEERDVYGGAALPNLLKPGQVVSSPEDVLEPVGFGPLAASWPYRVEKLGRHASTWSPDQLHRRPLPEDIDPLHFNAAPPDQRLQTLREDEHLFLDNLHPDYPRMAARLPGLRAQAFVERRGNGQEIQLRADTLWFDTARLVCTITWRGHIALDRALEDGHVYFVTAQEGQKLTWADVRPGGAHTAAPEPEGTAVGSLAEHGQAMALPFANAPPSAASSPPQPAPSGERALPVRRAAEPPAPIEPRRVADSDIFAAPPMAPPPMAPPMAPPPMAPPMAPPPAPAAVESPWANAGALRAIAPVPAPAPLPSPSASFDHRAGGVLAASNAATAPWSTPASAPAASPALAIEPAARPAARAEPTEPIQLLWFDSESVPRMRRVPRWANLLRAISDKPLDGELDDPALAADPMELEDRREVFELLAAGEGTDASGVQESLTSAVREDGKFLPRLALLTGDLQLPFDELETLKATTTTASPLVGQDETLKVSVEVAKEFLRTPGLLASAATADGLTNRIRESFNAGRRMVPAGYLEQQVERVLLEKRAYSRRDVFGAKHLRGLLHMHGSSTPVPAYMVEDLAPKLPMFNRFKVKMIVEVDFTVDQYESSQAALKVVAIARVLPQQKR